MAKYRVAVIGTVGKSVLIDDTLSSRVAALETQIANVGGVGAHSALTGLQQGDDHPQYTMWAAPETIKALWNFQTIPYIQGETLAEYIEDVVAGGSDPFISDSPSITWTYDDTGNHLQADVVDEYIEDLVGSMLVNTTYIDLDYGDSDGSIKAILDTGAVLDLVGTAAFQDSSTIDFTYDSGTKRTSAAVIALPAGVFANPSASIGLTAVNGSATTAMRSDAAPALDQGIAPTWTGIHTFSEQVKLTKSGTSANPSMVLESTQPQWVFRETDASTDNKNWEFRVQGEEFRARVINDANNASGTFLAVNRTGAAIDTIDLAESSGNVRIPRDGGELRLGAGDDIHIYHDGTNSVIRNDTGDLKFQSGATEVISFSATPTTGAQTATFAATNKPGTGTAGPSLWWPVKLGGTTYYIPLFGA